ncbi:RNA polymerase, sigma-24 subunit, ECF subfamily [Pirellula staleyi DSM 6068]|uniref:RNA polymerase, sigma-24 subunit, ECF subfamily n=1 Tax=Pirellula staleyi (strain ATCC 27377 / DSM 6068 / ICPB 4128) TaxID=530564 RepID=D2R291_PIRSD|nr:sigma-70 family RNA polymerase sigma factor [Pirellula staleyi]ADB15000.1 RNA polymerase, sigma-24 subunit, ECF subfamily [Pirellula staleyi DSM 6068]
MTNSDSQFPETHASLLLQVQAGDSQEAWLEFVSIYSPIIYRLARRRGLQDADAQDLAQKVLISISRSIEHWQKNEESVRFRHWLRRVAKNAICNALTRQPKDRAGGGTSLQNFLEERADPDHFQARELELEHRRELFLRAAAAVKADVAAETWLAFQLAVVEGLPMEEVAARVNKSVGAAYAARGRVMHRLRQVVDEMEQRES